MLFKKENKKDDIENIPSESRTESELEVPQEKDISTEGRKPFASVDFDSHDENSMEDLHRTIMFNPPEGIFDLV